MAGEEENVNLFKSGLPLSMGYSIIRISSSICFGNVLFGNISVLRFFPDSTETIPYLIYTRLYKNTFGVVCFSAMLPTPDTSCIQS